MKQFGKEIANLFQPRHPRSLADPCGVIPRPHQGVCL